jgi:hypothetical protein
MGGLRPSSQHFFLKEKKKEDRILLEEKYLSL